MTTMVEYLSGRPDSFPDWLDKLDEEDYNLKNFFRSRTVFYPGAGRDGHPLAIFNPSHSVHCYFFVDQSYSTENLEEEIGNPPTGYTVILDRQYSAKDLRRESIYPLSKAGLCQFSTPPKMNADHSARSYRSRNDSILSAVDSNSAVRLRVYEREPEYDESHGARRFAIFCLGMEARTAYEWFYGIMFSGNPPYAILLQDHGNEKFGNSNGRLHRAALDSGLPEFLIIADNTSKWKEYVAVPNVVSDRGGVSAGHDRWLYKLTADSRNALNPSYPYNTEPKIARQGIANMAYQGKLDGLCGPYAIVNAYHRCGLNEDWLGQDLFNIACLAVDSWPGILWEGASFSELRKMLAACQKELKKAHRKAGEEFHIVVEYPFSGKRVPKSNREYWMWYEDLFSCEGAVCGILGMENPHEHWLAFENRKKKLSLFDSDVEAEQWQIAKKDIHAGSRRRRKYRVNRRELVIFRSV